VQGHYLARPMPAVELERWLRHPAPLERSARARRG
jgi:EAL domain-containing protein (putative c-di-GMP-specific phosphodiesterase class I)